MEAVHERIDLPALVGQQLGEYQITALIGQGGMGTVYEAYAGGDEPVAIKVINESIAGNPSDRRRFQREASVGQQLTHPHVLPVLHIGQADEQVFMVMPFVRNGSLQKLLDTAGWLTPARTLQLVDQIGSALDYAHEEGLVHRDLKPDNIMRMDNDTLALADFGLAHFVDSGNTQLTTTGMIVGTPAYMSPEQALGLPLDGRTDLYTLTLVAYRCLVGRLPFNADSAIGLVNQQIYLAPIDPRYVNPHFPSGVAHALMKGLDKHPDDRFQSGAEFAEALADGFNYLDPVTFQEGTLTLPEQVDASRDVIPGSTARLYGVPGSLGSTVPGEPTEHLPTVEMREARLNNTGWRWAVAALALLVIGLLVGFKGFVQPLQQRTFFAEQTAQAAAEQTPIIITQVVTNAAGEIVVVEATRLVTAMLEPDVSETPTATPTTEGVFAPVSSTLTPSPTVSRTPTVNNPPPSGGSVNTGGGSSSSRNTGGSSSNNKQSPSATPVPPTPTPMPTATPVPPTATPVPPPTATPVPPPTATPVPPTDVPPTDVPPTDIPPTDEPATETSEPETTEEPSADPTEESGGSGGSTSNPSASPTP